MDGDLFEIVPEVPYTAADLNWMDKRSRSTTEMNDDNSRPVIAKDHGYDTVQHSVCVGFPIWWYRAPHIIETFLESYDFAGKTVIPFVTSGGSGWGKIDSILGAVCPAAVWLPGKRMQSTESATAVQEWVNTLNL